MSESLNNQETNKILKMPMGLKERNEEVKEPGHAEQTGEGDELTISCAIHFPNH